jgi:hypothetical protein
MKDPWRETGKGSRKPYTPKPTQVFTEAEIAEAKRRITDRRRALEDLKAKRGSK